MTSVRKWKTALLVLAGLALALAGVLFIGQSKHSPSQSAKHAQGFGFAPGHTYEYTLRYDTLHHAAEGIGSEAGLGGALQLEGTYALSVGILVEGALSFLGYGVQLPHASLGLLIQEGSVYMVDAPWLIIAPGCVLVLAILAINVIGDSLRDRFEPRETRRLT